MKFGHIVVSEIGYACRQTDRHALLTVLHFDPLPGEGRSNNDKLTVITGNPKHHRVVAKRQSSE